MAARTAVVAGTATAVSGRVARRQAARYDQSDAEANDQQQYDESQSAPPPAAPGPAPTQEDTVSKLNQLAELHTQGVLSDAEFTAAKAKILGI